MRAITAACLILALVSLDQCSPACAGLDLFTPGRIRFTLHDAPARVVLEAIAATAGLDIVMPPLPGVTLTVHLGSASCAEALAAIADVTGLTIEIRGRIMVVFPEGRAPPFEEGRLRFARQPRPPEPPPEPPP